MVWLGAAQGAVGAKHAVNPSMGARSRHPWRSRFCTHCALLRFIYHQRLLLPQGSREKKDQIQIQVQRQKPKSQFLAVLLLLLLLLPLLPPWGLMRPRPQETVEGRPGGLRRTVGAMDGAIEPPRTGLRRVLRSPPGLPQAHQSRRAKPQPRALLGFTRFPKKIALISSRSVPCQYLRCAGSSANSTTLPCPCADTSSHALPATRARLRSER